MISAKQLRIFEYRLKCGLMYVAATEIDKDVINSKPFGGIHILFGGDFWQLDPIACDDTLYLCPKVDKQDRWTLEGYALWQQINAFVELTENCRFKDLSTSLLASFNRVARIEEMTEDLLARMNAQCLCITYDEAMRKIKAQPNIDAEKVVTLACRNVDVNIRNKKVPLSDNIYYFYVN